eukprot:Plantae.Rhodophyta-Purpureofilum_apyrenoidigerum.ctg4976.p1 GENE.Plantae.Rhodophyta-Purpureofilum_apyrenoidigerum.ctg4976~~Plantae.Rhodophyta-Purpureofilum_apyrenoidigerum.ctg4976.p1  ORF type:complete len:540 (+),score=129.45 Plantae.Rhodophyta-Purpureofilum_apyrenoidigerum.ctg4976:194-1813(+)
MESSGKREREENGAMETAQPVKKRRSRFSDAPESATAGNAGPLDPEAASKKAMAEVKRLNEELGVRMGALKPDGGAGSKISSVADRLAQLEAKVMPKLGQVLAGGIQSDATGLKTPLKMELSSIPIKPVTSLTVNVNKARQEKLKKTLRVEKSDLLETDPSKNKYFDPRLNLAPATRPQRQGFRFVEEGTFVSKGEKIREKAELERIQEELRQKEKSTSSAPQVLLLKSEETEEIPEVEWWDIPFLVNSSYDDLENTDSLREDRVTKFVHHPVLTKISNEEPTPAIPLMLTQKERKRHRHQKRMEREKEKQMLIQTGVEPPPPPKVKLSNMMRVLGNEASQDPTKVEAEVRKQIEGRRRAHEEANEARKPSKEEKKQKADEKIEKDKATGLFACVFRIKNFTNAQHRFKVNINAEQNHLSGCAIYNETCNIVVAEGGFKGLNKFKKLMLRRIDWLASVPTGDEENGNGIAETNNSKSENRCVLIWEGQISRPAFKNFMATPIPTEDDARQIFRRRKVEQYWDSALAFPIDDETVGLREM